MLLCIDFIKFKIRKNIKFFWNLQYHMFMIRHYFFLVFVISMEVKMPNIVGLINNMYKCQTKKKNINQIRRKNIDRTWHRREWINK